MGSSVSFLPGDSVRELKNGKPTENVFVVKNMTKDGLLFESDSYWHPVQNYQLLQDEKSNYRRKIYSMITSYERSCRYYGIDPIKELVNEYSQNIPSAK